MHLPHFSVPTIASVLILTATATAFGQFSSNPVNVIRNPRGAIEDLVKQGERAFQDANDRISTEAQNARDRLQKLRDDVKNAPNGWSEELWGQAGSVAYPIATQTMLARSPHGDKLDFWSKVELHAEFGDLVHRVRIHWGVKPLDEWVEAGIGIRFTKTDSSAQTYGHHIFVREGKDKMNEPANLRSTIALLAHELTHSRQFESHGSSYEKFGYHYFKRFKQANQVYENNEWEREAFAVEDRVLKQNVVALDANGGAKRPYCNPNLRNNDNLYWKIIEKDGKNLLVPKVKNQERALDANGGRDHPYVGTNKLPNANILWQIQTVSGFSAFLTTTNTKKAISYTGKEPTLESVNLQDRRQLWDVIPHADGFVVLVPKNR